MNKYIFPFYRALVPKPVRTIFLKKSLKKNIVNHFSMLPPEQINDEQREVLVYLENNPVSLFPYPFDSGYSPESIEVFFDESNRMMTDDPEQFREAVCRSLRRQVEAINKHTARGTYFFDYGNAYSWI